VRKREKKGRVFVNFPKAEIGGGGKKERGRRKEKKVGHRMPSVVGSRVPNKTKRGGEEGEGRKVGHFGNNLRAMDHVQLCRKI